jgi:XTP/dITP diphosphohydrolase
MNDSPQTLLYATSNQAKLKEVREFLRGTPFRLMSPAELGLSITVDETGETLEANATLKARAYLAAVPDQVVMADDTGLEINALGGEPGVKVRRWKDGRTAMTDEEIIEYCLARMRDVPVGQRQARFRTVIALGFPEGEIELFDGELAGEILTAPTAERQPGFPFRSLAFIPQWDQMLGEAEDDGQHKTHRELAVEKAIAALSKRA